MNNLLLNKIRGTRQTGAVWKCYPHVVLIFDAKKCLSSLPNAVWGASANVGRSLKQGDEPNFRRYDSPDVMMVDGVQEILIPAAEVSGRTLPLNCLHSLEVSSGADKDLVCSALEFSDISGIPVILSEAKERVRQYTAGQSSQPGVEYLRLTNELFDAIQNQSDHNTLLQQSLVEKLATECFD